MKNARQKKILELIERYSIGTQETLIARLRDEGYEATQTTISRDINQLKLLKAVTSDGTYKYIRPDVRREDNKTVLSSALTDAVIKIEAAKNIVVIKTLSGMANAIAVCIDSLDHDHIIGSVAGDDTVIIVTKENEIADAMELNLKAAFKVN